MNRKKTTLTIDRLRDVLEYDCSTGLFKWRKAPSKYGHVNPGDCAGTANGNGYVRIWIDGVLYHAHRIAWFYVHMELPTGHIDHINGIKSDNRIDNLRDVDRSVNLQNRKCAQTNNRSGLIGAHAKRDKFTSSIQLDGVTERLGTFNTAEDAHHAYLIAKRVKHEGNTL